MREWILSIWNYLTGRDQYKEEEQTTKVSDDVAEHYQEMTERGANVKGEGEITP